MGYAAQKRDAGLLWIDTVGNVSRYLRERLDASLSVDRSQMLAARRIVVRLGLTTLGSSPIAGVYDQPLTLRIAVPGDWAEAQVEQGARMQNVVAAGGHVEFDAVPGPVAIVLTRSSAGPSPADFDGDRDVDLGDFSLFQLCFGGPNAPVSSSCRMADFDWDGDVDLVDFGLFQGCFNGPNRPVACL